MLALKDKFGSNDWLMVLIRHKPGVFSGKCDWSTDFPDFGGAIDIDVTIFVFMRHRQGRKVSENTLIGRV